MSKDVLQLESANSFKIRLIPMYVGSHSSSSVTKTNVSGGEELFVLTKIRFDSIP